MPNDNDLNLDLAPGEDFSHLAQLKKKLNRFVQATKSWWHELPRGQKVGVLLGAGLALVILLGGTMVWALKKGESGNVYLTTPPTPVPTISLDLSKPKEPKDHENPIDGVLMTQSNYEKALERKPLLVMIDNLTLARPQSGLNSADLVYEALVEGGITRFMALFWQNPIEKVGPVRSMRSYFLDWIAEWDDPLFMHIGGAGGPGTNPKANALAMIQQYGMKSVGISVGGNFWREPGKVAPHNAYSSLISLWAKAKKINWIGPSHFATYQFKDDLAKKDRPETADIKLNWNGWGKTAYSVVWTYDPAQNVYLRQQGGKKAIEELSGEQISAKNVIIQFSLQTLAKDVKGHILYKTIGNDRALIFKDGKVIDGSWEKASRAARTKFYDAQGNEIKLNRGRIWIEVAPTGSEVEY